MSYARALEIPPVGHDPLFDCLKGHVVSLLKHRRSGATICPSEAARWAAAELRVDWRDLMRPVREVAAAMAEEGLIEVTQHGLPVDVREARGPVRLKLKRAFG